ncbi:MAG: YibE/F family protein, partial [Elusimicrobiota bacterium]|nr:YibE/F family protein [Elusimicrobiota bacterium]
FFIVTGFKKKGAMLMVALNIFFVIPALFFIIKTGFNPVGGGIIISGIGILISVAVILGGGRKLYSALSGALIGSTSAGIVTLVFMDYMKIEGRFAPGARMLQTASRYLPGWNIHDLKGVVAAGIMIASLGAVIDIAVSMVSAINEVYRENPRAANTAYLFKAGLNVGRDMVATMLNSLVLVFTGLALPMLMIFGIMEIPLLKAVNFEFILITILSAAVSSISLMITVPVTACISSRLLPHE